LEDGTFKSDHITIGNGCTVGTGALVNYGVTMEDGSALEADAFLMKGTRVLSGARWRGNPATEVSTNTAAVGRRSSQIGASEGVTNQ
jgi:acetyltransferase-like isoleucine patch superfamily enzyme